MEQADQVSETAGLVRQPIKMINLICEQISDRMEPSQSAFVICIIASQASNPSNKTECCFGLAHILESRRKKIYMAAVNMPKFKRKSHLYKQLVS